jgi:tRNA1(Val) A37 N6-methylase TrmN6
METALTEDALLGGRVRLLQSRRGYRVAIDAVLLAAAVHPMANDRVLDLGAGVGAVGLCLARRVPDCTVLGIELQPALAELAERNAMCNGLSDRVRTIVHDIGQPLPSDLRLYDQVCTNPPYLSARTADPPPDPSKALATVESSATLSRWLDVATGALKPAGILTLIHREDRLKEILTELIRLGCGHIAIKRLPPANRVLVRARHGAERTIVEAPPLELHRPDGGYTEAAEAILRHGAPLDF